LRGRRPPATPRMGSSRAQIGTVAGPLSRASMTLRTEASVANGDGRRHRCPERARRLQTASILERNPAEAPERDLSMHSRLNIEPSGRYPRRGVEPPAIDHSQRQHQRQEAIRALRYVIQLTCRRTSTGATGCSIKPGIARVDASLRKRHDIIADKGPVDAFLAAERESPAPVPNPLRQRRSGRPQTTR